MSTQAPTESSAPATAQRGAIIAGLVVLGALLATALIRADRDPLELRSAARRAWKETAIREVRVHAAETERVKREVDAVRQQGAVEGAGRGAWFTNGLVVLHNGDWIVCRSVCRKEPQRIHDLFIGLGSDGKWYYSTYHFCVGMLVLRMDEQPASLDEFASRYFARTFDGTSDLCLQTTWPLETR
jgi:hypothetical protein